MAPPSASSLPKKHEQRKLPVVTSFRAEEIDLCPEQGMCVQCGLCCIAYDVDVPEHVPRTLNERVETVRKKAGEICRHASLDEKGKYICEAQHMKDHYTLHTCRDFSGEDPDEMFDDDGYNPRRTNYFDLVQATLALIIENPSAESINQVIDYHNRGLIRMPYSLHYVRGKERRKDILKLLECLLTASPLPWKILDNIEGLQLWITSFPHLSKLHQQAIKKRCNEAPCTAL